MKLVPFRRGGMDTLRKEMNHLFEDFLGEGDGFELGAREGLWSPDVDVAETPESVVVKAEVPGIDPKEIEVSLEENTLTIRGERKEEKEEKGKTWIRSERRYGSFARRLTLPCPVEGGKASAESTDGILTITIPKSKQAISKRIEVKVK